MRWPIRSLRPCRFPRPACYIAGGLVTAGAGLWLLDVWFNDDFDTAVCAPLSRLRRAMSLSREASPPARRPRVVILGTGWGAVSALRKIRTDLVDVVVASPRNYFLFTPLLASTTTGLLEARSIVQPIRRLCEGIAFVEMDAVAVDVARSTVLLEDRSPIHSAVPLELHYDALVVAVGSQAATFGVPGVREHANFLKSIEDARHIRASIMDCFETAAIPGTPPDEVDRLLHFVVVGGGPAGIEFTAELYDFVRRDLARVFPRTLIDKHRISLIEALPNILPSFHTELIRYTENRLQEALRIDLKTRCRVRRVEAKQIITQDPATAQDVAVPYGTLVWVTGNTPNDFTTRLIKQLGPEAQPTPRGLTTDAHLRVAGTQNVFAVGDCSYREGWPATAQLASQQGAYVGRLLNRMAAATVDAGQDLGRPFQYNPLGTLAYIGNHVAIADFGTRGQSRGVGTWLLWRSVYLSKLLSARNRLLVIADWGKARLFGRDLSRF